MLRNFKRLFKRFIDPSASFSKEPLQTAFIQDLDNPTLSRLESYSHFDFESSEDLKSYKNIKLVNPKDIMTFLNGIDTFIFDCDGVIVKIKFIS